jgi:hypothetical protein
MAEKVEIKIVVDKQTGAMSVAGQEIEAFGKQTAAAERSMALAQIEANKMNESMGLLGQTSSALNSQLASFVGAAAIASFFRGAVQESLAEAEALRVLKGAVESTGAAFDAHRQQIEKYAAVRQATTRFDDTETFQTMSRLALATKSVAEAMTATSLAQDLAARTGRPLAETTATINALLLGQERAVKQATREYGNFVGGATNAQDALDNLQKSVSGAAQDEDSFAKSLAQSTNFMRDFQQTVGDGLVPVLAVLSTSLAFVVKGWEQLATVIAGAMAGAVSVTTSQFEVLNAALHGHFREAYRLAIQGKEQLKQIAEETASDVAEIEGRFKGGEKDDGAETARLQARVQADEEAAKQAAEKRLEIQRRLSDEVNKQVNDEFEYKRMKLEEEIAAAQAAGVAKMDIAINGQTQEIDLAAFKAIRETQIAQEQAAALSVVNDKIVADKQKKEKQEQELEKIRKANFQSTLEFISSLSNAKNKELALIGKAAGLANAYINTGVAVTRALAAAPPPFNFALAAAVGAAGAAQIATIAGVQLEHGGVTEGLSTEGVLANIGEKRKKEGVLPLENPKAMRAVAKAIADQGGAGSEGALNVTVGDVNVTVNVADLTDPAAIRQIAVGLAEEIQAETVEAITLARRSADLNAKNIERAV